MIVKLLIFAGGALFGMVVICCLVAGGKSDERSGIK